MKKVALALGLALAAPQQASAITINLYDVGGAEKDSAAYKTMRTAANFWESVLTNDATINFNVSFANLPLGFVAGAETTLNRASMRDVITNLNAARSSALDAQVVLPPTRASTIAGAVSVDALISAPAAAGTRSTVLDNDGSANNSFLLASTGLMKALGMDVNYYDRDYTPGLSETDRANQIDGRLFFSPADDLDFDASDGVIGTDFLGVVIHEMGHAFGFWSGVDTYDALPGLDLNSSEVMSVWDLFRYSRASAAAGVLDWSIRNAAFSPAAGSPYFSIDGGATNFGDNILASGASTSGATASHWNVRIPDNFDGSQPVRSPGILAPFASFDQSAEVSANDIAAFDAMGYSVAFDVLHRSDFRISTQYIQSVNGNVSFGAVPEPAVWGMMIVGFGMVGAAQRRRRPMPQTVRARLTNRPA